MNALRDYYRCPDEFLSCLEMSEIPTGKPGYFRFAGATLFGSCRNGEPVETLRSDLTEIVEQVEVRDGRCYLPFDADEVVTNLREERYLGHAGTNGRHSGRGGLRNAYYFVRPLLGVRVRKHLQRFALRGRQETPFPSWPVDRTVDRLFEKLILLVMQTRGVERVPFIWFWPHGHLGCAMMTHDVETAEGLAFCPQLMDLDDTYGVKSSFQVIPAPDRYIAPAHLLDEIRRRDFEINVHDWNHDGLLYSDEKIFCERAKAINQAGTLFEADGFRSGALYRNTGWYDAFTFAYDMSVPNVGHLEPQPGGCCTVMPYFIGHILELPVTTVQDYSLFHILGDYSITLWKKQLDIILGNHGLASFIVHPDYVIEAQGQATYTQLLEHLAGLRDQRKVWLARPRDVNRWWRERSEMKLVGRNGEWEIEGVGKERASVAYATRCEQGVAYSLQ